MWSDPDDRPARPDARGGCGAARRFAWFVVAALAALLVAFFVGSSLGVEPAWIALAGAAVVGSAAVGQRRARPAGLLTAAAPQFLLFVVALAVIVDAAVGHGLGDAARDVLPAGDGLPALLAMTGLAALLANLVNNVPATLVLSSVVPGGEHRAAARHAAGGQRRPQPQLHRVAGDPAVAARSCGPPGSSPAGGPSSVSGPSPPRSPWCWQR